MNSYENTVKEMLKNPYHTPRCSCHKCGVRPVMHRTDRGVVCPHCGYRYNFTEEEINNYNNKHGLTYPFISKLEEEVNND